jgi:hypothetical protein
MTYRSSSSNRETGLDRLCKTWRIVFAPVLMQLPEQANREYQLRPVTIARRASQDDMPTRSGRRNNQ